MIRLNSIKQKLKQGKPVIGTFVKLSDPSAIEIIGLSGFDFFVVDCEHVGYNPESIVNLLRAADISGIVPLIRVRENRPVEILQALDAGALGVLVPQVNSRIQAQAAADAAHYPPAGTRGYAPTHRAAGYGLMPARSYVEAAEQAVFLGCYCETMACIHELSDILTLPGIDLIFIGPNDLAASMGYLAQPDHPDVVQVIRKAVGQIAASDKAAGIIASNPEDALQWIERGCSFVTISSDQGLMAKAAREMIEPLKAYLKRG